MHVRSICRAPNARCSADLHAREANGTWKADLHMSRLLSQTNAATIGLLRPTTAHLFDVVAELIVREDLFEQLHIFSKLSLHC